MDLNSRQLVWRTRLLLWRAARDRRRRLVHEIGSYRTRAEQDDLLSAIEHCPLAGREEIRRLLACAALRAEDERTPLHLRT